MLIPHAAILRRGLALLMVGALLPVTWLREPLRPASRGESLHFVPVPLPPAEDLARHLGPFALEGVWQMTSPCQGFGGYSALVPLGDGRLLAIGDNGGLLWFAPPGRKPAAPKFAVFTTGPDGWKRDRDAESATRDPATGTLWVGWEWSHTISRHAGSLWEPVKVRPRAMRDWGVNSGAEAMVRLADGRFVVLGEGFSGWLDDRTHPALLFSGDPVTAGEPQPFTFAGPARFSPTDMAQLPDGRVLIVMRRAVWPMPFRFAARLAIADPAEIRAGGTWQAREVALLTSSLPVDNFEGIAIEPQADGRVTVWLISDDNNAVTQRTLLWKLSVDPARLPGRSGGGIRKKARD
jgi:hypothetical protein